MKGRGLFLISGSILAALICAALWLGYVKNYAPIGLGDFWMPKTSPDGKIVTAYEFQRGRTLWDWMQLLVVPALLFVAGLLFNKKLKEREAIAALDTQREAALQKYFDVVGDLFTKGAQNAPHSASPNQEPSSSEPAVKPPIERELKHEISQVGSQVTLAPSAVSLIRARTLTVLAMLDGRRKGALMRFLLEAELVQMCPRDRPPGAVLSLENADLRDAELRGLSLRDVPLSHVDLRGADLRLVNLKDADIRITTLIDDKWQLVWKIANNRFNRKLWDEVVDLKDADLAEACLNGAELNRIDLRGADLRGTSLDMAQFQNAVIDRKTRIDPKWFLVWKIANDKAEKIDLRGSDLLHAYLAGLALHGKSLLGANIAGTDLSLAFLEEADLRGVTAMATQFTKAKMTAANLSRATLFDADFSGAKLPRADLSETLCPWAKFGGANLAEANLRRSDLRRADLSNADLSNADLTEALLSGTNLEGAVLSGTRVSDEQLANAKGH